MDNILRSSQSIIGIDALSMGHWVMGIQGSVSLREELSGDSKVLTFYIHCIQLFEC